MRTGAAINDINILLRGGALSTKEVSDALGIPLLVVESQKARIERRNEVRRKFLATGVVPREEQMVRFSILQK
jgi:hypothetical protein